MPSSPNPNTLSPQTRIALVALISEGILAVIALIIAAVSDNALRWSVTQFNLLLGTTAALPPLVLNLYLWRYAERTPQSVFARFSNEVVIPLCRAVDTKTALLLAILSGVCEELFFRGALNAVIIEYGGYLAACLITSTSFAAIHFIGSFKRYGGMIPLYAAIGCYIWLVHHATESLAVVAVLHGVYNFVVILMVARRSRGRGSSPLPSPRS
jgi:membrane protease YdiL (CAAX protease family)